MPTDTAGTAVAGVQAAKTTGSASTTSAARSARATRTTSDGRIRSARTGPAGASGTALSSVASSTRVAATTTGSTSRADSGSITARSARSAITCQAPTSAAFSACRTGPPGTTIATITDQCRVTTTTTIETIATIAKQGRITTVTRRACRAGSGGVVESITHQQSGVTMARGSIGNQKARVSRYCANAIEVRGDTLGQSAIRGYRIDGRCWFTTIGFRKQFAGGCVEHGDGAVGIAVGQ